MTAAEVAARNDLPDWRYLLGRLEATYRCGTFGAAGRLAASIADAADAAGHHPDIDLRYPDLVHVALTTHAANAEPTELDVELAITVAGLAADAGARSEPTAAQGWEIAIDAMDIAAVSPFWEAVLGYRPLQRDADGPANLVDPVRIGPAVWFQQMDEPRPQRNRIHVDITVAHDVAEARVAAALAAGGVLVSAAAARSWWILADVEGNEVCVCTWQDRD
ncbi:MAG: VOC family protein [Ilumatobacteraceae bacterium]